MNRRVFVALVVWASLTALAPASYAQATKTGEQVAVTVAKTSDGRDFAGLSPEDVKKLPRAEKEVYYAWKEGIDNWRIEKKKQAAVDEDIQIRATPIGKWIVQASKAEKLDMPPKDVQLALWKLASQKPPPNIIYEARIICDKLGIKYND